MGTTPPSSCGSPPKPGGKASLVVQHMKLAAPEAVEQRRAQWREAFAALAAHFGG
ncbi:MAG: hypothetical protein ACT4QD_24495 [Acidobacteriota bacterium]